MSYQLGAAVANTTHKTYVNLRLGRIAETSKEEKPDFEPTSITKKDGTKSHFFAKQYSEIIGYITKIDWHVSTFKDGSNDGGGWNVDIDTGDQIFCLSVKKADRPFFRFCSVLCGVNFDEPVRFAGYKFQEGGQDKKVLCLYQYGVEGALQPVFAEKWVNQLLRKKIVEKVELTDDDKNHLVFDDKGKMLKTMVYDEIEGTFTEGYPYITQSDDGKWNLSVWAKFLDTKVREIVIPAIAEANDRRKPIDHFSDDADFEYAGEAEEPPMLTSKNVSDDDIPF